MKKATTTTKIYMEALTDYEYNKGYLLYQTSLYLSSIKNIFQNTIKLVEM